jgi:hypothetical protein
MKRREALEKLNIRLPMRRLLKKQVPFCHGHCAANAILARF